MDEHVMIPLVLSANIGISFFAEDVDPMLVVNCILNPEARDMVLGHQGIDDKTVVPLAFTAHDLQKMIPEMIEGVIRARTIIEMVTTWPERRDEIIQNLTFRWTGQVTPDEDGANGQS